MARIWLSAFTQQEVIKHPRPFIVMITSVVVMAAFQSGFVDSTHHGGIAWAEHAHIRHDQQLALLNRRGESRGGAQEGCLAFPGDSYLTIENPVPPCSLYNAGSRALPLSAPC
jgi:hypothetical protein